MSFVTRARSVFVGAALVMAAGTAQAGTTSSGISPSLTRYAQYEGGVGCTLTLSLSQLSGGNWIDAGASTDTIVTDIIDLGFVIPTPLAPNSTWAPVYRYEDGASTGYNIVTGLRIAVSSNSCSYDSFAVTAQNLAGNAAIISATGTITTSRSIAGAALLPAGGAAVPIAGLAFSDQSGTPFNIDKDVAILLDDPVPTGAFTTTLAFTLTPIP